MRFSAAACIFQLSAIAKTPSNDMNTKSLSEPKKMTTRRRKKITNPILLRARGGTSIECCKKCIWSYCVEQNVSPFKENCLVLYWCLENADRVSDVMTCKS